tara:strand:+ start:5091 stop:5255 length:165 start_codon:yes stop_codon:yes gene_type:complete
MRLDQREKNDLIVYALSFLSSHMNDNVEEDLEMNAGEIEAKLRSIIKDIDLPNE